MSRSAAGFLALAFAFQGCQKLGRQEPGPAPTAPVPVTPTPGPSGPVVIGTPGTSPTPSPAPTSTTSPTPGASPTATPGSSPGARSCTLPPMPNCGSNCCAPGSANEFQNEIEAAQADLRRNQPALFNSDGSIRVDEVTYTTALARRIVEMTGICAVGGLTGSVSRDEIGVKRTNELSQNVDVLLGSGQPWVGTTYTCRPASF